MLTSIFPLHAGWGHSHISFVHSLRLTAPAQCRRYRFWTVRRFVSPFMRLSCLVDCCAAPFLPPTPLLLSFHGTILHFHLLHLVYTLESNRLRPLRLTLSSLTITTLSSLPSSKPHRSNTILVRCPIFFVVGLAPTLLYPALLSTDVYVTLPGSLLLSSSTVQPCCAGV